MIPAQLNRAWLNQQLQEDFRLFLFYAFKELHGDKPLKAAWHIDAMCRALEVSVQTGGDRLLITIGPRHLKSVTTSVAFVAWMMGRNPALKFLVASYGFELSNELAGQFRQVVTSAWFKSAFPRFKLFSANGGEIKTTLRGCRKAVSVGGVTTGFGADYIIVDDLTKAQDADHLGLRQAGIDYFRAALVTRLDDAENGRIIVVGQRLHEEDVAGVCLETRLYRHLNLPAISQGPADYDLGRGRTKSVRTGDLLYYPQVVLDRLRLEMGPAKFTAQYLQDPASADSPFIRWHKIARYAEAPPREAFLKVVQSWDTAQADNPGADYSVCTTWGFYDGKWWLLHLDRFQADFVEVKQRVLALRAEWKADVVLIEEVASGAALLRLLRYELQTSRRPVYDWELRGYRPKDDKMVRWQAQAAKLEEGYAVFPEEAPWLDALRREVVAFPGRYDDQVDSISQFLDWSRLRTGRSLMQDYNGRPDRDDGPRPLD